MRGVAGSNLEICFVKHLAYAGDDPSKFQMLLVTASQSWLISTPLLPFGDKAPVGVGDFTSGVFLANYLQGNSVVDCLEHTTNAYWEVMKATLAVG